MRLTVTDLLSIDFVEAYNLDVLEGKAASGVSTDSRAIRPCEIFFALHGEKFDGSRFVNKAFQKRAICAVVDRHARLNSFWSQPLLVVEDTTKALGQLANHYRRKFNIPVIAIAGSNGKTTTKEMTAAILSRKFSVLSTQGNLNNHVGVPQTLFRMGGKHEVAVIELGTNHFGELKYLCEIVKPTHGLITNIGHEHLEFFGDLNGVAREEGQLFTALGGRGTAFVNVDDKRIVKLAKGLKKKMRYGFSRKNIHVGGKFLAMDHKGCTEIGIQEKGKRPFRIHLPVPGKHTAGNALAAAAVGLFFDIPPIDIQRALNNFTPVDKRMDVLRVGGATILNDTYNANPDSMISALETLSSMKCRGKKVAILADMLELGKLSKREHEKVGGAISSMGLDGLLTCGSVAKHINAKARVKVKIHYASKEELSKGAAKLVSPGDIVLVKGSRGMKMEEVVNYLHARLRESGG